MSVLNTAFVASAIFILSACVPPPTIRDNQSAVVGISMRVHAPVRLFRFRPDKVYFVTAERREDLYGQGRMVPADYIKGDRAYLLNASPGYYAAVAAYHKTESNQGTYRYTTFFTQEVVEQTVVGVGPGAIVYMGDYAVNQDVDLTNPDVAQLSFMPLIDPTALLRLGGAKEAIMGAMAAGAMGGGFQYSGALGEANRDRGTEETFLGKAMDDLREGGWSEIVQRRIDALKLHQ